MCEEKKDRERGCVCEVVRFIHNLQSQVKPDPRKVHGCTRPTLDDDCHDKNNTRPFVLYLKDGSLFKAFFEHDSLILRSPIFRVEKIDGCCALLRVLRIVPEPNAKEADITVAFSRDVKLAKTDSFITVDLNCFCGIQCIEDRKIKGI